MDKETQNMVDIIREIQKRFDKAAPRPRGPSRVGATDVLVSRCPECLGTGASCSKCDGEGVLRYKFAKEIVALAKALAYQDPLSIAQVLSGLAIGMKLTKQ